MKSTRRKIMQRFSIALAALCLFVAALCGGTLSVFGDAGNRLLSASADGAGEADERPVASIVGKNVNETDGVAYPSADGYVYFTISLDKAPAENVRVYYHTRNMTAIAEEGDYDAVNDSVVLTPDSYAKSLAVKVYATGYLVKGTIRDSYNSFGGQSTRYIEETRKFSVSIYGVESENNSARLSDTRQKIECSAGYANTIEIKDTGYLHIDSNSASPLFYNKRDGIFGAFYGGGTSGLICSESEDYWYSPEVDGEKSWISDGYVDGVFYGNKILASSPNVRLYVQEKKIAHYKFHIVGYIRDENWSEHAGDVYVSLMRSSPSGGSEELFRIVLNTDSTIEDRSYRIDDSRVFKNNHCYGDAIPLTNCSFLLPEIKENEKFYYKISNPDNSDDVYLELMLRISLYDNTAPEVVGCYVQSDVQMGENIGLTLKLSEPIHVLKGFENGSFLEGVIPQVKTALNGSIYDELIFNYVSGNGTDALYFEAEIPEGFNKLISSIQVRDIVNIDRIRDFSDRIAHNLVQPTYVNARCTLDFRTPSVSFQSDLSTAAKRRVEVPLTIDNVSGEARLYYTWTNSEQTPEQYDYTVMVPAQKYTVIGQNMDGIKYLHVKVVSAYGKSATFIGPKAYRFDNTPPQISATLAESSTLTEKKIRLQVSDGAENICAGLGKVYALISQNPNGASSREVLLYSGAGENQKDIVYTVTAEDLGLGENEYGTFYIGFYAVDVIGNQTAEKDIVYKPYRFDRRNFFSTSFVKAESVNGGSSILDTMPDGGHVVDCTSAPVLYFEYDEVNNPIVESFKKADGNNYPYESIDYEVSDGKKLVKITLSAGVAGYAELSLSVTDSGTKKISDSYSFYFTKNGAEQTAHYQKVQNGVLLINKVYQLSENFLYAYKDADGVVKTAQYGNTALPASFSSAYEAKRYVYYRELLDLYAVKINAAQASWLNEGTTSNYVKAKNESTTAVEGQIWIRYKSESWESSSSSNAWVYYYYGPSASAQIDTNRLSNNLLTSLNTVSDRIVGYGAEKYLVGEGNLNALGEPYLAPAQLHIARESAVTSLSGTLFTSDVSYSGDLGLYASHAKVDGQEYVIATNLPLTFGEKTKLFYKSADSSVYQEIVKGTANYLSDVIRVSGVYELKEYDENGMSVFSVYIDRNAPVLSAMIKQSNGEYRNVEFDEQAQNVVYNVESILLNGISPLEKDEYSYVAVYKYITSTTGTLLHIYNMSQLENEYVMIEDGNYHIEVSDRSGNSYTFVLRIDSTGLICSVTEEPNVYIKVDCNRAEEQIASYEVLCNGRLVTSTYSPSAKFTQGGFYEIHIRDIYGNEFSQSITFERELPTVSWKYNVNGSYVSYHDDASLVSIMQSDERVFVVKTSVLLQFTMPDGCSFSSSIEWNENPITHARSMNSLSDFVLVVWYTQYEDLYVTYFCSIDNTPPAITVNREAILYSLTETQEILDQVNGKNIGDVISYSTIGYKRSSVSERPVSNGETVSSHVIKLSAADVNGIDHLTIYLDGALYLDERENFNNISLSRYGEYVVEAADFFGNIARFTFKNSKAVSFDYSVDEKAIDTGYSCYDYFEGNVYKKVEYGSLSTVIKLDGDMEIAYRITSGSASKVTAFSLENGVLCGKTYRVRNSNGEKIVEEMKSAPYISLSSTAFKADEWYRILTKAQSGADIFARYDTKGNIYLKVEADPDSEPLVVEGRVYKTLDTEPFYFKTELSKGKTKITLLSEDYKEIESNTDEKLIKINKGFTISNDFVGTGRVRSVKVYHSEAGEFSDCSIVYDGETFYQAIFFDEGIYLIEVENVYGVTTKYNIILSEKFVVTVKAIYSDGVESAYSVGYNETVYSNGKINVTAYADNVSISVTKDGIRVNAPNVKVENGNTIVILEGNGNYVVTVSDEYGNTFIRKAEILLRQSAYTQDLIYGFNEAALKRDQGYTNQKLSVSSEILKKDGFAYLSVRYGEKTAVLYDLISEKKTELEEKRLVECIGTEGDGEYTVLFRDKYGNMLTYLIKYRNTPTLELSRTLRSSTNQEPCDVKAVLTDGLWSNNTLHFESVADEYVFTVNGKRTECPYSLSFGSGADEGSFEYAIRYTDEYGFVYEFTATLLRRTLEISLPSSIESELIEGIPTTRSGFSVIFDDRAVCTYSLNGGSEVVYEKDSILYTDGVYRFTATDLAGNVSSYTVKKDSAVFFKLIETATGNLMVNGGIACTDKVSFEAIGDDAFIEKVFHDGKHLADYSDDSFNQDGMWELLVSDKAGNQTYFSFYIITHPINRFEYTAPYLYRISEAWFDSGDGTKISYMDFITGDGTVCDFSENGTYSVVMISKESGNAINFSVTVNNIAPVVMLVGCEENETTINDVTVKGYRVGDTIEVYRNGKLVRTVKILTSTTDAPVISEGGEYTIVVRNEAGVETSLSFTRKHIPNIAGNVLIFIAIFGAIVVISVGMFYRNHSKTDD